jgi:hypothetical protein
MKMMGVTWGEQHYIFAYANDLATEPQPDQREVIICEMSDHIDQLTTGRGRYKEALERIAANIPASRQNTPITYLQGIAKEALEPK